jgi:hypothetical protein
VWAIPIALVIGLPIGLLAILYFIPASRPVLREYQTLTGSLITLVTAGIALFGVWVAVDSQRQITKRQLAEQHHAVDRQLNVQKEALATQLAAERQAAERQRSLKRQQVAGAFVGEITMILATLSGEPMRGRIESALAQLRVAKGVTMTMDIMFRRPGKQLDAFYRANTVEIGQFQAPLPELLTRFYGLYAVFEDVGWQLNREVETGFKDTNRMILEETVQNEIDILDQLRQLGPTLITQLDSVRNSPVP